MDKSSCYLEYNFAEVNGKLLKDFVVSLCPTKGGHQGGYDGKVAPSSDLEGHIVCSVELDDFGDLCLTLVCRL